MPDFCAVDVSLGPGGRDVAVRQSRCAVRSEELRGLIIGMIHAPRTFGSHPVFIPVARIGIQDIPLAAEENRRIVNRIQIRRRVCDPLAFGPPEIVDQILIVGVGDHPLVAQNVDQLPLVQHAEGIVLGRRGFPQGGGFRGIIPDSPLGKHVPGGEQGEHQEQMHGLHKVCHFVC